MRSLLKRKQNLETDFSTLHHKYKAYHSIQRDDMMRACLYNYISTRQKLMKKIVFISQRFIIYWPHETESSSTNLTLLLIATLIELKISLKKTSLFSQLDMP